MVKKTKIFLVVFVVLILTLFFTKSTTVSADMGPKPKLIITVKGETSGRYLAIFTENHKQKNEYNEIDLKFESYENKYIYGGRHINLDSQHEIQWGYNPPNKFKIVIYDSNTDTFISNNKVYYTYQLSSYYEVNLKTDSFSVRRSYDYSKEIVAFFLRLTICIAIELVVALLFRIFKKDLIVITITNIVTQIGLNLAILNFELQHGLHFYSLYGIWWLYLVFLILLELIIFVIEAVVYYKLLYKKNIIENSSKKGHYKLLAVIYAIVANLLSFLATFIPFI